jgi:hypothetical protein
MSFVVARMQKVKSGNLVGVGNHNQRNTDNHSNKDIDVERSHLNYFKDSKQVTTEQVKTLVSGVLDKVKEFVKGGEFEKIHRNETQTRDRDELSR